MIKAHRIQSHPTPEQAACFARTAGTARLTFNRARAEWQRQLHYESADRRLDWLHTLTTRVAKTGGLIAVEDLAVSRLIQNRCLSRSFSDAASGALLDLLESKVLQAGGRLMKVGRFYPSSQSCHRCGTRRAGLTLDERIYVCANQVCGYVGDRDENACDNILQEALRPGGP